MQSTIDDILAFWFGPLDKKGLSAPEAHKLWFAASKETDDACQAKFGRKVEQAVSGELTAWVNSSDGLIALILLLDQMTRNIYRGTAAAFSGDSQARALALTAIHENRHLTMPPIHRVFLYLPLEHSEDLEVQDQCVALFEKLATETKLQQMTGFRQYAVAHRDVIAQFGRFPHRNSALGRKSTPEELQYLSTHKGF